MASNVSCQVLRILLEKAGETMKCQYCSEAEAEVEVEIPIPENGRETVELCVDCATETKEDQ